MAKNTVGLIIKSIRESKGISQSDLAPDVGVPQPRLSEIENGDHAQRSVLISIAQKLDSPEVLLKALRKSPILHEAMAMLGVDLNNPDPGVLIKRIREELTMLESDINLAGSTATARADMLVDMCHMLTLLVAFRSHCG